MRALFRGALRRSLNCRALTDKTFVLESALPYAAITEYGGPIQAGGGPLGSKLLAIPLNATARAMLDSMGASVSLRTQNLIFLKTRRGRMVLIQPATPVAEHGPRGKTRRGAARQHTMFEGQILFVLVPRVQHAAQPFAPRMSEPAVRSAAASFIRQHLKSG